jgi:hypothetical protein
VKIVFVLTTINIPYLIKGYVQNILNYNHNAVEFIIIGDKNTPHKIVKNFIKNIDNKGLIIDYWDINNQKEWLKDYPNIDKIIPYNSDNRRNIGFLLAFQRGADIIISLDDDNYVLEQDYIRSHQIIGNKVNLPTIVSKNGWFNPCSMLDTIPQKRIYSRGFPYHKRSDDEISVCNCSGKVVLNMGLWIGDPDVDAVTNLNEQVKVKGFSKEQPEQILLTKGTYSPINTQNTAFHRNILPCFYYIMMGEEIHGMKIDRYGDIWTGLFAKKVIDHMNDRVSIGNPLTHHRRNKHDLLKDLQSELWGMLINEKLVPIIENIDISGSNYSDAYIDLAQQLSNYDIYEDVQVKKYFKKIIDAMKIWVETCERL